MEANLYQRMERLAQSLGCRPQMRQMHQKRCYLQYALGTLSGSSKCNCKARAKHAACRLFIEPLTFFYKR